jgi:hypothetical protein
VVMGSFENDSNGKVVLMSLHTLCLSVLVNQNRFGIDLQRLNSLTTELYMLIF